MLTQIVLISQELEHPFFPYSNLFAGLFLLFKVPHSTSTYDISRHLAGGDVIFSHDMATILVKCSKTNQFRKTVARIAIPIISGSLLSPVAALKVIIQAVSVLKMIQICPSN